MKQWLGATALVSLSYYFLIAVCSSCNGNDPDDDTDLNDGDLTDGNISDSEYDSPDGNETFDRCDEFPSFESGNDGATDLTVPPSSVRAVAGRITSETQLLRGLKPKGRIGDILMANSRIALVIEDARPSDGYSVAGGEILDVDLVDPDGPRGESLFIEMFQGVVPEVVAPEEVSVLTDGSDGGDAIVRVAGELRTAWIINALGEDLFPRTLGLPVALDYLLAPEDESIRIRLTLRNNTTKQKSTSGFLTAMLGGDGLVQYAPKVGFDNDENFGSQAFVGLIGNQISYAWVPAEGSVQNLFSQSGINFYGSPSPVLPACAEITVELGRLVVSGGDTSQIESAIRRSMGQDPYPAITGTVFDSSGTPLPGARVHATDEGGTYLGLARTGENGRYLFELALGEVRLQAWADAHRPSEIITLSHTDTGAEQNFTLGASGTIAWVVRDEEGTEVPAQVTVTPLGQPAPTADAAFGEPVHPQGAMIFSFSLPGRNEHPIAVGEYRIVASRGFEYEYDEAVVTVDAGETEEVELTVIRSVDTSGWLCGDFHVHTMYSPDSSDLAEFKVAAAAATGIEIPISTDHRYVSDLQPVVEALGLEDWIHWYPGQEITTFSYGHFNAYPLPPMPEEQNQGAIDYTGLLAPALFDRVDEVSTEPILQINHPRSSFTVGAYFSHIELDATDLSVTNEEEWSLNFDAVEVFNGSGWTANREDIVRDWFGFLNNGHLITATGNSDSHSAEWREVGYPRTCLPIDAESPRNVSQETLRDLVRSGRAVVSGGLFVTAEAAGGIGPGGVAAAPGGETTVRVIIQAPVWVDADFAEVIINGVTVETITLDESTEDPENGVVRLDRTVHVMLDEDGWLLVGAWADGSLSPISPRLEPFGATNAIFFDVDGDGIYRHTDRFVE